MGVVRPLMLLVVLVAFNAVGQTDIYRVEAPVANQSEAERINAAKATLADVITNVVGDASAVQNPTIKQALNDAPNYLAKFSYVSDASADPSHPIKLVLNYSPQAIHRLLVQAQLIGANAQQELSLQVNGVRDFGSYKQVQTYLKTLAVVRRTELIRVENEMMFFKITIEGDVGLLKTNLSAANKLQVVDDVTANPSTLSVHWQSE